MTIILVCDSVSNGTTGHTVAFAKIPMRIPHLPMQLLHEHLMSALLFGMVDAGDIQTRAMDAGTHTTSERLH